VAEKNLARPAGEPHKPRGELALRPGVVEIRRVHERGDLPLHRRDDARMAMPDRSHRDPRAEIEIALAVLVPYLRPLPTGEAQVEAGVGRDDVAGVEVGGGGRGGHCGSAQFSVLSAQSAMRKT